MTAETESTKEILLDLAKLMVDEPDRIEIGAQETRNEAEELTGAYYAVKCSKGDESLLLGRSAIHAKSFAVIVAALGRADGRENTFRLITTPGSFAVDRAPRHATRHDPEPSRALLTRLIEGLGIGGFSVKVGPPTRPSDALTFLFSIEVVASVDLGYFWEEPSPEVAVPIFEAIATLFRAVGRRNGVRYELKLSVAR